MIAKTIWTCCVFFWSLTYILLVVYMVKYKTIGIPVIAMLGNFAWEFNLMMSYREDVFQILTLDGTIWCLLDVAVILAYLFLIVFMRKKLKRYFCFKIRIYIWLNKSALLPFIIGVWVITVFCTWGKWIAVDHWSS